MVYGRCKSKLWGIQIDRMSLLNKTNIVFKSHFNLVENYFLIFFSIAIKKTFDFHGGIVTAVH